MTCMTFVITMNNYGSVNTTILYDNNVDRCNGSIHESSNK